MKKTIILVLALVLQTGGFATLLPTSPSPRASSVMVPLGNTGKQISLQELSVISLQNLQELTGKKMNLADRITFKLAQKELRNSILEDGSFDNKKLKKLALKADGSGGFNIGGFALGFLVGLIGVLIAYLINDDKKKARVKWAWLGLLAWLLLVVIFVAV